MVANQSSPTVGRPVQVNIASKCGDSNNAVVPIAPDPISVATRRYPDYYSVCTKVNL